MISHVSVGVRDVAKAKKFYTAALKPLGLTLYFDEAYGCAWGRGFPTFWAQKPFDGKRASSGNGVHVCFNAPSKAAVDSFHRAALKLGGRDDGKPGIRAEYTPNYYAAFVRDPDGNKIEALCFLDDRALALLKRKAR
ncbi:MAG: VOC family protein [Alphaproteobacteria bacterium]|nr:VOC family protein [Alphaproteobacteria bacterium]